MSPLAIAALVTFLAFAALVIGKVFQNEAETRERQAEDARAADRAKTMLYASMTVDEAQRAVWAWEEMTQAEREALPLERRVELRQIREDLAKHRQRFPQA